MKVEVKEKSKEKKYPCLMQGVDGLIVLLYKPCDGVVLVQNDTWNVGYYYTPDGSVLKPFDGSIILSND